MRSDLEPGWAVMCRDTGVIDGDALNVVEVLTIYWAEEAALAEVHTDAEPKILTTTTSTTTRQPRSFDGEH